MSSKGKYGFIIGIAIIILLAMPLAVFAEGFIETKMRVRPTLGVSTEYTTNLDLNSKEGKDGIIYRVTPGLSFQFPLERTYIEASGDVTYSHAESGDETTSGHTRGLLRYNLSNSTSLGISHDYTRGELYGVTSDTYDLHTTNAMIKHLLGPRLALSLGATAEDYENDIGKKSVYTDYKDYSGNAAIDYKLSKMTTLTLSGEVGERDYKDTETKDYDSWSGILGISNRITPRITLGLSGGYTERDYELGDDAEEYIYGGNIGVRLSNFSTLAINYDYSIQDTFYSREKDLKTFGDRDAGLLDLLHEEYKYTKTHRAGVNLAYNFTDKDTFNLGGGYSKSKSDQNLGSQTNKLDEKNYFTGIGLSHKFTRWLALNAGFVYGERTSNVRNKYDYKTYTAGLSLAF